VNALRLPVAAAALTALYAAAVALGACSNGPSITFSVCNTPIVGELGADGGPDPCHCDPPPELNMTTCGCLDGNATDVSLYQACMALYGEETKDAGGPIEPGACAGGCWPAPPAFWTTPDLLWFGAEIDAPSCPPIAPTVAFAGFSAGGAFALACSSTASGTCPGLGSVCAPGYADGFAQCVTRPGASACPLLSPYNEPHVFTDPTDGAPVTFCCMASPVTQ
jgi:hypothetical protein